jgi:hypothetical protein
MGPARGDSETEAIHGKVLSVLAKAGYEAVLPPAAAACCGLVFDSRGLPAQGEAQLRALEQASQTRARAHEAHESAWHRARKQAQAQLTSTPLHACLSASSFPSLLCVCCRLYYTQSGAGGLGVVSGGWVTSMWCC